jgi:predicted 3-demethylubiquinone-9 3-methyltransferase (glyoxalase superfamily)
MPKKIKPCLWFDDRIEEAVNFYVSLFPDGKILETSRYPEGGPGEPGKVMVMNFKIADEEFMALNGGPEFQFDEAVSFYVDCESQAEVDRYWNAILANGGSEGQCAWIKDRFGLWWQIVPNVLGRYLADPDPQKSQRVMQAMLQMQKIEIADLDRAYKAA